MSKSIVAACLAAILCLSIPAIASEPVPVKVGVQPLPKRASLARIPLAFEPNRGQAPGESRFIARSGSLHIDLRPDAWKIVTDAAGITMRLVGARKDAEMYPEATLAGRVSYFHGHDPAKWQRGLPTYGRILTKNAYAGINVAHYGNRGCLEHDFIVAAGAKADRISIEFEGAQGLKVLPSGDLEISTPNGRLRQLRPIAYQMLERKREPVAARYKVKAQTVRFELGHYDHRKPLVIDPVLSYSSYLGGVGYDVANAVVIDDSGAAYVTGGAGSTGFPFTPGAYNQPGAVQGGFVAKINPQGTGLIYCVNFGDGLGNGVAVDAQGNAYVGGTCTGLNFPVTPGAFRTEQWGSEAFIMKIDPTGTNLVYSSRFGGSFDDFGNAIAVDAAGNAVLVGTTSYLAPGPGDFPTFHAAQPAYGGGYFDMFVTKLNASGTSLVFSTYLGGGRILNNSEDYGTGVAVDPKGNVYVGGMTYSPDFSVTAGAFDTSWNGLDGTVTKFTPQGVIVYSTFIGGVGHEEQYGLAVDAAGSAYVTGFTNAQDFPTTPGVFQRTLHGGQDAYLAKLSPDGGSLVYGTYFGGTNLFERGWSVAVDASGNAWLTGDINEAGTSVYDYPILNAIQAGPGGGLSDGFVAQFGPTGALLFSSYLGGTLWDQGHGIALDGTGAAYVVGSASSDNFPTTAGSFQPENVGGLNNHDDAFVLKISPGTTQSAALASYTISPSSVPAGTNAIGTITLTAPAPPTGANITLLTDSPVVNIPVSITIPAGQTRVSFSIGTQIPAATTTATLGARYGGVTINAILMVTVNTAAPALNTLTLSPSSVVRGSASQGTVTLTAAAPSSGITVQLSSSSSSANVPSSVIVPAGATSATFAVTTLPVTTTLSANVAAVYLSVTKSAVLSIQPSAVSDSIAITKAQWKSGKLTVEATGTNPTAILRVFVTSSGASIGTLTGSGGRYKGTFNMATNPLNITVRSSLGGSDSRAVR